MLSFIIGAGHLHSFSNWLEQLLARHQSMIEAVTALSAAAVLVIAIRILLLVRQQAIVQHRAIRIAGTALFVANRDSFSDHLGYLCYWTMLGHKPNMDSIEAPRTGLSLLLDTLRDKDPKSLLSLKDHPLAAQFRPKGAIMRSPEIQILRTEMHDFVTLANDSGCATMVDGRIADLYAETTENMRSIRGPG
jgi:hypothetical protein